MVVSPSRSLLFHLYQPDGLVRHRYGMLEPDPASPEIPPDEAALIIVPGLAFARDGYRLGYGGGFYDRLLGHRRQATTLGVCFHALLFDELPHGDFDAPVDSLVTETLGVMRCRAPG
jgi:5-formyltetrahydrofolate cyclo-ligase